MARRRSEFAINRLSFAVDLIVGTLEQFIGWAFQLGLGSILGNDDCRAVYRIALDGC